MSLSRSHFAPSPTGLTVAAGVAFAALLAATMPGVQAAPGPPPAGGGESPAGQSAPASSNEGLVGADTCLICHQGVDEQLGHTAHGRVGDPRAPVNARGCESCHGPGQAHAESGDPGLIRTFAPSVASAREDSATCLSCHTRGSHALWDGSTHDTRAVSCTTCHSVHHPQPDTAQLAAATEVETCGTCHQVQVLEMRRTSHMPIFEGKLTCSSCHDPHGSTNVRLLRVGNWINESCVSCHAEKRGPFLWEHGAGRESCISCHDPHGSSNDRMLVAKLPMLCQRCHIGTRHPSTIYDATGLPGSNRLVGRSCVNCHQNIHGSNHPSGSSFLR